MSRCSFAPDASDFRSRWKGWEIAAMVAGFIVFWPLGLAMLLYKKLRRQGVERPAALRFGPLSRDTGNVAFEAYKADELRRLEEERRQLAAEQGAFEDFLYDLKRAKDREEFDAFIARRAARRSDG
ncbi:DUF2852 domain-containing protein [Azorhizobium caulinodans]|nr:DUF2852 domain-containing protein [Azorhizobium caulinodans]